MKHSILLLLMPCIFFLSGCEPDSIHQDYTNTFKLASACDSQKKGNCTWNAGTMCDGDKYIYELPTTDPEGVYDTSSFIINSYSCANLLRVAGWWGGTWTPYVAKTANGLKTQPLAKNKSASAADDGMVKSACLNHDPASSWQCSDNLSAQQCYSVPLQKTFYISNTTCSDIAKLAYNVASRWYLYGPIKLTEPLARDEASMISDSSLINNACAATVSSSFVAHIPIFTYSGSNYWADIKYNLNSSTLTVSDTGIVSDMRPYSNCTASTLSQDLKLHVPAIIFNGDSYWVTLQYSESFFAPIEGGKN